MALQHKTGQTGLLFRMVATTTTPRSLTHTQQTTFILEHNIRHAPSLRSKTTTYHKVLNRNKMQMNIVHKESFFQD